MKLVISGGRNIDVGSQKILRIINCISTEFDLEITELVVGCCLTGVDQTVRDYVLPTWEGASKIFTADWDKHGRAAGPIRNREMAEYADFLLAFWDGRSRGTKSMINEMYKLAKPVKIVKIERTNG